MDEVRFEHDCCMFNNTLPIICALCKHRCSDLTWVDVINAMLDFVRNFLCNVICHYLEHRSSNSGSLHVKLDVFVIQLTVFEIMITRVALMNIQDNVN